MWDIVDWKGKDELKNDDKVNESQIKNYFTNIFQSEKTVNNPIITDVNEELSQYNFHVPMLDATPNMGELEIAMKSVRRGISFDGLPPAILNIIPNPLKMILLTLVQKIFLSNYPDEWNLQMLHAVTKHGHTYKDPQLRGIAIAPLFCRVYDALLENRFSQWYMPNYEQAGFRPKQGCLLPLFTLILLIIFCKEHSKNLFVGFLDYAKAFDYANRAQIIRDLMNKGCGKSFVRAVYNMYGESRYAPKIGINQLGDYISSQHGVTQGKKTSSSLFSFYVSDMCDSVKEIDNHDFLNLYSLIQLADDTMIMAETFESLRRKFIAIFNYSKDKYQVANFKKTFYANFSNDPTLVPMDIDNASISCIDNVKGHVYLGMTFIPTNDFDKILMFNLNKRMFHIAKYYGWLEINETTPIETKLLVLDNCAMSALLYACEAWGDISCIAPKLISIELKLLKRILGVKSGTSNDLVYFELKRSNIISKIKDRQYNFFHKLQSFSEYDAIVVGVMKLCQRTSILDYYNKLHGNESCNFMKALIERVECSDSSMITYYKNLIHNVKSCIYTSFINDYYRIVITRWRLSCHGLKIETGRYARPFIPREDRLCSLCHVLDDENHAIFTCSKFNTVRQKFDHVLSRINCIKNILNPKTEMIIDVAKLLYDIQDTLKNLNKSTS